MKDDKPDEMTKSQKVYVFLTGLFIITPIAHFMYYGYKNPNLNDIHILINKIWNFIPLFIGIVILKKKVIDNNGKVNS